MDRVELMRKKALDEELTVEEEAVVKEYMAELMEKTKVQYREIERFMYGENTRREDRRPARPVRTEPKIGRNNPCKCNSGKKYKTCCGRGV